MKNKTEYPPSRIILFRGKPLTLTYYEHALNYGVDQLEKAFKANVFPFVVVAAPADVTRLIDEYMKTGGSIDLLKELVFKIKEYPPFFGDMDYDEEALSLQPHIDSCILNIQRCFKEMTEANKHGKFAQARLYCENARFQGESLFAYLFFLNLMAILKNRMILKGDTSPKIRQLSPVNFIRVRYQITRELMKPIIDFDQSEELFRKGLSSISLSEKDCFVAITGCIAVDINEKIEVTLGDDGSIDSAGLVARLLNTSSLAVFMPSSSEHDSLKKRRYVKRKLQNYVRNAEVLFGCPSL